MKLKDEVLDEIVRHGGNVAQFASYSPEGEQRFCRIRGLDPLYQFTSIEEAVAALFRAGTEYVNIRTFLPEQPDGNPFFYGPKHGFNEPFRVATQVRNLFEKGYHVIVNEEISTDDGGFSGVLYGDLFEFASRDIPRCVEKPGCAKLPRSVAMELIRTVYGFNFHVPYPAHYRVECSIHPAPVGYFGQHQIVWQAEEMSDAHLPSNIILEWPNRYSQDMGDKTFGLLIAVLYRMPVPFTSVFGRVVPHFTFGTKLHNGEAVWVRTAPNEQQPGLFTTKRGWLDPFALMQREDPDGSKISAILVQEGVEAEYSGAAITDANGNLVVEGKSGYGDSFMVGESRPDADLPKRVKSSVEFLWDQIGQNLGDIRFEWVYDGNDAWIVQLHVGRSVSKGNVIFPGEAQDFVRFPVSEGLDKLRKLVKKAKKEELGIILEGDVGITSHFGDLLRRNQIPSRLEKP